MRTFEDFRVGEVMTLGPVEITAANIRSFAERFDPEDPGGDPERDRAASGLHAACLHMRLFADSILRDSASMGSPGVEEVRFLAPVRAGDRLILRIEVVSARPSRSRPEMGLVVMRSVMVNADAVPVLEMTATLIAGRREGGAEAGR